MKQFFCLIYHQQVNVPQQSFETIMWVNAALSSFNFKLKVIQLKTSLAIGKLMGKNEYLKIYDILLK